MLDLLQNLFILAIMKTILITSAMRIEAFHIKKKLFLINKSDLDVKNLYQNNTGEKKIYLLITGIGPQNSKQSLHSVLQFYKPDLIINAGSAGALSDDLGPGQAMLPKIIMDESRNQIKVQPNDQILKSLSNISGISSNAHALITGSKPVKSIFERRKINRSTGADLIDMEAYPQAEIASDADIEFLCLKVITDRANHLAFLDYLRKVIKVSIILTPILESIIFSE